MKIPASPLQADLLQAQQQLVAAQEVYARAQREHAQTTGANPQLLARIRRAHEDVRMAEQCRQAILADMQAAVLSKQRLTQSWNPQMLAAQLASIHANLWTATMQEHRNDPLEFVRNCSTYSGKQEGDRWSSWKRLLDFGEFLRRFWIASVLDEPRAETLQFLLTLAHHLLHDVRDFEALGSIASALTSVPVQRIAAQKLFQPKEAWQKREQEAWDALCLMFSPVNGYQQFWQEWRKQLTEVKSVQQETGLQVSQESLFAVPFVKAILVPATSTAVEPAAANREAMLLWIAGNVQLSTDLRLLPALPERQSQRHARKPSELHSVVMNLRSIPCDKQVQHFLLTRVCLRRKQLLEWSRSLVPEHEQENMETLRTDAAFWEQDSELSSDEERQQEPMPTHAHSHLVPPPAPSQDESSPDNNMAGDFGSVYDDVFGPGSNAP